ncbi:hypothetical protein [Neobacillus novalis]|nr:hypothetical protein [Neobacillus novalis]
MFTNKIRDNETFFDHFLHEYKETILFTYDSMIHITLSFGVF